MLLTLIICTYRRPKQVEELIAALGNQTTIPSEILLVDGSSDSETATVVQRLQAADTLPNLHYFQVPPEHRGLTRQRNYGIARAKGEFIAFLDDDTLPDPTYFAELLACFERHPATLGVGAQISNEVHWQQGGSLGFVWNGWTRRDGYRWRLRKRLGIADQDLQPGCMPIWGHARSPYYLPPDGKDYEVEYVMGGVSIWRREVFETHQFSRYFEGYGLYEDLDFCVRVSAQAPLIYCTRAKIGHFHAPSGRPNQFSYGIMVARNGWFVWRRRWPQPSLEARVKWWLIMWLLTVCRLYESVRGPQRWQALTESFGRIYGMFTLLLSKPTEPQESA
ncbi:MAG: glycosyltransferase family 2 protein [Candidatus Promineifilaceae bacterium]